MLFSAEFFTELGAERAVAVFPESWPIFEGHFPGKPVVPAYVLIGLVLAQGEHSLGPLEVASVDRMKLARAVSPGEAVTSELAVERQGAAVTLRSRLSTSAGEVGTLILSARVGA